jgi:hypothetical protein
MIFLSLYIEYLKLKIKRDQTPIDLKINRGNLFFEMDQGIKFDIHQAKGSQDIEWSVYSYVKFDPLPLIFFLPQNQKGSMIL